MCWLSIPFKHLFKNIFGRCCLSAIGKGFELIGKGKAWTGKGLDLRHQGEGFRVFSAGFLSWVLVLVVMGRE